jgi:hypothetical protein
MKKLRKFLALPFIVLACILLTIGSVIMLGFNRGGKAIEGLTRGIKGVTK